MGVLVEDSSASRLIRLVLTALHFCLGEPTTPSRASRMIAPGSPVILILAWFNLICIRDDPPTWRQM